MKKEEKDQVEKILDITLVPRSLLQYWSPLMFTSPRTGKTTLIPRHVITHIQVFPIRTDIRMPSSQHHHRPQTCNSQHGIRAIHKHAQISETDLHNAARSGNLSKAQETMSVNKELIRCQNAQGNLPLHLAIEKAHKMVALYLVAEYPQGSYVLNGDHLSPLYLAVEGQHLDIVKFMFQKLALDHDLIPRLKQGKPIVHAAITTHNQEMLQVILKLQPELIKTKDAEGRTPLSCAAYHGFADMVEYLLKEFPKSKSRRDEDSSYAVHKASVRGHIEVLKIFHSISPKSLLLEDRYGRTILHVAAKEPRDKLKDEVSYLVGLHGIGKELLNKRDENDKTPLDLALSSKNHQIVEILQQSTV